MFTFCLTYSGISKPFWGTTKTGEECQISVTSEINSKTSYSHYDESP